MDSLTAAMAEIGRLNLAMKAVQVINTALHEKITANSDSSNKGRIEHLEKIQLSLKMKNTKLVQEKVNLRVL